ncbi:MAG TPA: ATP-binding protein [Verrucomicrobiae bacterium]|nr:ATP-binding protein [Verrucomicrobiae bacterium]
MASLLANLRLRSKFLLSMVLVIAALSGVTLLVIRQSLQQQARQDLANSAQNAVSMFKILEHQRQVLMSRKADLLATSAFLSDDDASSFNDSTNNPLDTSRSDLMALADASGKIVSLHTTHANFPPQLVEDLLRSSLARKQLSDWWLADGRLYQVEIHSVRSLEPGAQAQTSTVIVGQEFDERNVRDLAHLLSSEMALRYNGKVIVSTFDPYRDSQLSSQLFGRDAPDELSLAGQRYYASSVLLTPDDPNRASLIVFRSDADTMALLERLNRLLLRLGLFAVVVGGLLAFVISSTITKPLAYLVRGVQAVERGDYDYHLKVRGGGEVAKVTAAFESMRSTLQRNAAERQQLEDQLRQSQKMEALGRLAGGVAHDFNNLLTIIKGHSELLLDRLSPVDPSFKSGEQIHKAADRASSLTRQLLVFSRRQILQPKVLDLNHLVTEIQKLLHRLIREDVEFVFIPGKDLAHVKADPGQLEQVLMNLTVNASDAMPQGGNLVVETRNLTVDASVAHTRPALTPGDYVLLSVTDTGHGMDAKTQARIFEPFFTTKEVGKGTGLGLSTVYGIVKQSGGFIYVESAPGKGTCFEVYLPQVQEQCDPLIAKQPSLPSLPDSRTVLVVEDDNSVRELAGRFLDSAGFRVLAAKDGLEALQLATEHRASIGALLTDVVMPRMRGTELAARLTALNPDLKIIYMTGYLEHIEQIPRPTDSFFLEKPFSREALLRTVNDAFRSTDFAHLKR